MGEDAYDIALADPPYASELGTRLAALWLERPFSRILSIEHAPERSLPRGGVRRVHREKAVTTYRLREKGRNDSPGRKGMGVRLTATPPPQGRARTPSPKT